MGKREKLGLAVALFLMWSGLPAPALSESLTMTTTYPSPAGIYRDLIVTQGVTLARDAGNVGIGTSNPTSKFALVGRAGGLSMDTGRTVSPNVSATLGFNRDAGSGALYNPNYPGFQFAAKDGNLHLEVYKKMSGIPSGDALFIRPITNASSPYYGKSDVVVSGGIFAEAGGIRSSNSDTIWLGPLPGLPYNSNPHLIGSDRDIMIKAQHVGINGMNASLTFFVNGPAGGTSTWSYSDERLKNFRGHFEIGLREILQLKPVRFRYQKDNPLGIQDEEEHVGFSAQQVEKVIPEAVIKGDQSYRLLDKDPILCAMLNAIKEQEGKIESQGREIQSLKAELKKLTSYPR